MKKLTYILPVVFAVFYLAFSFVSNEFFPSEWSQDARFFFILLSFVFSAIWASYPGDSDKKQ